VRGGVACCCFVTAMTVFLLFYRYVGIEYVKVFNLQCIRPRLRQHSHTHIPTLRVFSAGWLQVNAFIVRKGAPGFTATKIENKIALRCVQVGFAGYMPCLALLLCLAGATSPATMPQLICQANHICSVVPSWLHAMCQDFTRSAVVAADDW
jgi:hypothetical protein